MPRARSMMMLIVYPDKKTKLAEEREQAEEATSFGTTGDAKQGDEDSTVKIIVLTTFNEDSYVRDPLRLGASGFLLKVAAPERLVDAICVAANGDALLDPLVTRQVIAAFTHNMPDPLAADSLPALGQLTVREAEVLRMLARKVECRNRG